MQRTYVQEKNRHGTEPYLPSNKFDHSRIAPKAESALTARKRSFHKNPSYTRLKEATDQVKKRKSESYFVGMYDADPGPTS